MPGKKNRQRRRNRNRNKQRRHLTPNEVVLLDSKDATHPLHTWPTTLVALLLSFKTEMEEFERGFNLIMRQVHDNYIQAYAIRGFLEMPLTTHPVLLTMPPELKRIVENGLKYDTDVLDSLFTTLHEDKMYPKMGEKGCTAILEATSRHIQDVFDTDAVFKTVANKALKAHFGTHLRHRYGR